MLKVEVYDVGRVAHLTGVKADVRAVEVKSGEVVREANSRITANDDKVFVQAHDTFWKFSDALVFAVGVTDAERKLASRYSASVASERLVAVASEDFRDQPASKG